MSPAVKMDDEAKAKLEELQAEIRLKTGTKVTQQEILPRLVKSVLESREEFIDSFRDGASSLTDEQAAAFNQGFVASGVETDEDDLDDILYESGFTNQSYPAASSSIAYGRSRVSE